LWGASKFHLPTPRTPNQLSIMTSPQNVNARTVVPIIVNPELIPVDLDSDADLEQIQREVAAEQRRIKEVSQAKLVAARECIENK